MKTKTNIKSFDPRLPVADIINVLAKYKMPIVAIDQIIELVKEELMYQEVQITPSKED